MRLKLSHIPTSLMLVVVLTTVVARAQDYRFEKVKPELDWPTGTINALIQDHLGMIWIGSQSGIARFDGQELTRWEYEEGDSNALSSNHLWILEEDADKNIWVGTNRGISYWERKTGHFKTIFETEREFNQLINYSLDIQGRFWFQYDGALTYFKKDKNQQFVKKENELQDFISWRALSRSKHIYFTKKSAFLRLMGEEIVEKKLSLDGALKLEAIRNVGAINMGKNYLLTTTNHEVYFTDEQLQINKRLSAVLNQNNYSRCNQFFQDTRGLIWICSDYGVWLWDQDSEMPPKLIYNEGRVYQILEDKDHNIWISSDHGLQFFNAKQLQFKFYGVQNHPMLGVRPVFGMTEGEDHNLWVAAMGGLFKFESQSGIPRVDSISFYNYPNHIPILSSIVKEKDFMWVGSLSGLHKFYPPQNRFEKMEVNYVAQANETVSTAVLKVLKMQDKEGLWLATRDRLYTYNVDENKATPPKVLQEGGARSVLFSDDRFVWSVEKKLFIYDALVDSSWIYPAQEGRSLLPKSPEVICLYKSKYNDDLWIGTVNGAYRFNLKEKSFVHYNKKKGLSNERVLSIEEDEQHRIWMATDGGLNCYVPTQDTIYALLEKDGLPAKEFNQMSSFKTASGYLFFGCIKGLLLFHPDSILFEGPSTTVVLTDLQMDYQSVLGNEALGLPSDASLLEKIVVPAQFNMVGLRFVAPSYGNSSVTSYAFRLKGYHDNWIYKKSNERFISYTNLPPGDYIFEVKAANNRMVWGQAKAVSLTILPAFYESWWFLILCFVLGAGLIAGVVYSYARYQYNKKVVALKTQQKIQAERTRISRDLHDNVGANLSQIIMGLDILEFKLNKQADDQLKDKAKDINEAARSGIQQLRDTVWALKKDAISLPEFEQKIQHYLTGFYRSAESELRWDIKVDQRPIVLSPNTVLNLFRIIQESTNNTLKYAEATSQSIHLKVEGTIELVLEIIDNGKGFVLHDFDNKMEHNGLKNMRFRANSLGGTCSIESEVGKGTRILVVLPLDNI